MLVVFEGIDNMGKSTLIKRVQEALPFTTFVTKEPGSPWVSENVQIRELVLHNPDLHPFQRELLFYADALAHTHLISQQKSLVLCDRGMLSHQAYLYGLMKLRMLGPDPDANYTRYMLGKDLIKQCCAVPDAVVYLQGDIDLMRTRQNGAADVIERLPNEFFAYVLAAFDDALSDRETQGKPTLILDAKSSIDANSAICIKFCSNLL